MLLQCLPSNFSSIWLTVWEEMLFEEFQDGHCGDHLGHQNRMILAILNLYVTLMLSIKFWLNPIYSFGGDVVWRISRWPPWWLSNDLGYQKGTILAILNLYVITCLPSSQQLYAQDIFWCKNNRRIWQNNLKIHVMNGKIYCAIVPCCFESL